MESKAAVIRLAALAQDTRLAIFRLLVATGAEGLPVGQIGERLGLAGATLSFHLKELTHANLTTARQQGRFVYYTANYAEIDGLLRYLTENCCAGQPCAATTTATCTDCP